MRAASSRAAQEDSIIREIEDIRDKVQGLHRHHLRPGRPHRQHVPPGLPHPEIEAACRKPSCVYPGICQNLTTDHGPLIQIYRARAAASRASRRS
jgi:radical SAM superfamily enzyme YgiQ (UPF0313 family)